MVNFDNFDIQTRTGQIHFVCIAVHQNVEEDVLRNAPRIGSDFLIRIADEVCGGRTSLGALTTPMSTSDDAYRLSSDDNAGETTASTSIHGSEECSAALDINIGAGDGAPWNIPHMTQDYLSKRKILDIDVKKAIVPSFSE